MERIPRAIYTRELREEAVKLVTQGGLSMPEVERRLGSAMNRLFEAEHLLNRGNIDRIGSIFSCQESNRGTRSNMGN